MSNKKTKKELFGELLGLEEVRANEEMVNFINHELELLAKKASSGTQTKTQKENEELIEKLYNSLANIGVPTTITDLQKADAEMAEFSNQKLSALMKKLVDTKRVVKTTDKKKSYFSIA